MTKDNITANEVKKILTDAGFDFKFWGWDGVLNIITSFAYYAAKEYEVDGYGYLADEYRRRGGALYDALAARGFYD